MEASKQDMAQMLHWMLGKMDSKTVADYHANPAKVVAKLLKND